MICPTCGSQIGDNLKFCTQCGTPLENAAPAATYQTQADNPTELFTETPVYQNTNAQSDVYQPATQQAPVYQDAYQPAAPDYSQAYAPVDSAPYDSAPVEEPAEKGGKIGLIFGIISLVLSIISPLFCCCGWTVFIAVILGIASVVLGALGMVKAKKANDKAGKILSIIGLCLGIVALIPIVIYAVIFIVSLIFSGGMAGLGMFEDIMDEISWYL